jgi:AraC-like DNA-binding protein
MVEIIKGHFFSDVSIQSLGTMEVFRLKLNKKAISINININNVFLALLLSYTAILLIPLIISSFVSMRSSKVIMEEINRANAAMLKQLQQTIDDRLKDVERLSQDISLNPRVNSLKGMQRPIEDFQQYNIFKISQDMGVWDVSNLFIDNIYIYLKETNSILTGQNFVDSDLSYEYLNNYKGIPYKDWIDYLNKVHRKEFITLETDIASRNAKNIIAYVQSLPMEDVNSAFATLVISMDINKFQQAIQNIKLVNEGTVMILDKNNEVLVSTQDNDSINIDSFVSKMVDEGGIIDAKINNKKVVISYISSGVGGLKYVSIVPVEVFWSKMEHIKFLNRIKIFLCLLVGGVVTAFFLKKNYTPIHNIIKKLAEKAGISFIDKNDTYGFIMKTISNTFDENDRMSQRLKSQDNELRSNFLMKLLRGRIGRTVSLDDKMSSLNINFHSDYFSVLLFYIEDHCCFFSDEKNISEDTKLEYIWFIFMNVVEELVGQNNHGFMLEVDDNMYACLVNFNEGNERNAKEELNTIVNEAQSFIEKTFNIRFNISISNVHKTVAGISVAYQETLEVLEYKKIVGSSDVIYYEEMLNLQNIKSSYCYPLETEYQLINSIKAGELQKALSILDKVFAENFSGKSISLKMSKCFMFNMISTVVKAIDEVNSIYENNLLEELDVIDKLLHSGTAAEMRRQVTNIISSVCSFVLSVKKDSHNELTEDIIKYVEGNYSNLDLNISMIGDKFKMTPSYVSKIFSERTGEGLLDYINRVRSVKAKALLKDKNMSINDIAGKVGFNNSATFIRVFKKIEGITPGKYREISN